MKATGAELKQFYAEWPPGSDYYIDESGMEDENGVWILEPNKKYDLNEMGYLGWQGACRDDAPTDDKYYTLEYWFKKWKKVRTDTALAVAVPDEQVEQFKALCKERGWKVL